jgi:hypothetical protein
MKAQAARACIVAGYKGSYNRIQAAPDYFLVKKAQASNEPYYLKDLKRRALDLHIDIDTFPRWDDWKQDITRDHPPKHKCASVPRIVDPECVQYEHEYWCNGWGADISSIESFVCVPDSMKATEEFQTVDLISMYLETCRPED